MELIWKEEKEKCMQVQEREGVTYLTFPRFAEETGFLHGFSTRLGGVSQGIFSSMNLSFSRGDEEEAVKENYRRMAKALGCDVESMVASDQTHTTNVLKITEKDCGNGIVREKEFFDVDGMITNVPGVTLVTYYADCVPLYFIDPVHGAIGLSHSGWKGTVGKIGKVTVEAMTREFGSRPEDLLAAIGPSICQECYEVSEDVIEQFRSNFREDDYDKLFYQKEETKELGKYQLNLQEANRLIFREAGIREEKISMPGICTCCNPHFLFSHRASHGRRGNLAAFLGIHKK